MAITSAIILLGLATLLKPLRNGFYALHFITVVGLSLLIHNHTQNIEIFSPQAVMLFLILHLSSINIITFIIYAYDKYAARKNAWRVSEKTLHAFAFIGGTVAAFIAQKTLRHKTRKSSFRFASWLIFILQLLVLLFLLANWYY